MIDVNKNTTKVAIYCRLSEEDKNKTNKYDDSNSIKNQKALLTEFCLKNDWEIYNIYSDDDYSGGNANRPALIKLLKDAENRKFNIILCKSQSRFSRDIAFSEQYINNLFPQWGIRFISLVDNIDTAKKDSIKSSQLHSLLYEWDLANLSSNVKAVLSKQQRDGKHVGGFALYGYKKNPNDKHHLIIDEEAAKIVREIFILYSQGYGKTAIAKMLNERGVPNPSEYKKSKGLNYKNTSRYINNNISLWEYSSISTILNNEMYIGNMVQGKYGSISYKTKQNKPKPREEWIIVEGTHEPIISIELWNKVQAFIKQRARQFKNGEVGIFASKVKCMYCGHIMRNSSGRNYRYLKCSTRSLCKNACIGSFIAIHTLEEYIINLINEKLKIYLNKDMIKKELRKDINYPKLIKKLEYQIKIKEKDINILQTAINNSYLDKVQGVITEQEFINLKNNFTDRQKINLAIINSTKDEIKTLKIKMNSQNDIDKFYNNYSYITKLDRNTLSTFIDYIEVGKKNTENKELHINVYWKF